MQKLQLKLKNAPTDTPQVCSTVSAVLNRDENLSVQNIKLDCNNLDVDLSQHAGNQNLRVSDIVYVINMRGKPLMPTRSQKAVKLLKGEKAHVVKRFPFTIKLNYASGENKQEIVCGVDSGYKNIAVSCVSEDKELFSAEITTDLKTKKRLEEKRMYRRNRRSRLWYRKPRFMNRGIPKGWLPPSILRLHNLHTSFIEKLKSIIPISKVIFELGRFDIQKMENIDIEGIEYQRGSLYEYNNVKEYLLKREHGKCQLCGKDKKEKFEIHHIQERSNGGSNRLNNLALLHSGCHLKLHKTNTKLKCKKSKMYKDATFMNIIRNRIINETEYEITYGYITKTNRTALKLEKSHINDAFVIANGNIQSRVEPYRIIQKRRNNRSLQVNRKGFDRSIRRKRYSIQPYDLITVKRKEYAVKGMHCYGKAVVCEREGKKFDFGIKKVENVFHSGTLVYCS